MTGRGGQGVGVSKEEVVKFLGCIAIVQQLPRASAQRLAEVVEPRNYGEGEIIVQEGALGGLYFLWKGEAKISFVSSPLGSEDQATCTEVTLKSGDYFGYETIVPVKGVHKSTLTAITEVTCLVLHNKDADLLNSASIWAQQPEKDGEVPVLERILQLEIVKIDLFQSVTKEEFPFFGNIFGGHLIGQALAAACKTVNPALLVHSFHAYFLRVGDDQIPVLYKVERMRDGQTFSTRQVSAIQKGKVIFSMYSSFERLDLPKSFEHQEKMPTVPSPDQLLSVEDLARKYPPTSALGMKWHSETFKCPMDLKMVEPIKPGSKEALAPWQSIWIKTKGKLTDDPALHRCAAAYASDWTFLDVVKRPHGEDPIRILSLDHSMWFHKPFKADEWLLFVQSSPCASNGRALVYGNFFNQQGELVMSATQEGLMRKYKPEQLLAMAKL
ncbi:hypothetical protein M758_2G203400 [Ceratodon purpureus]|nr:hypothetical protein M758_2G203400 [Ceratodon purpureus]